MSVDASLRCAPSSARIEREVAAALAEIDPAVRASVQLTDRRDAVEAHVELFSGGRFVGSKWLVAPTCEEVTDSLVAVMALALSTAPSEQFDPPDAAQSTPSLRRNRPTRRERSGLAAARDALGAEGRVARDWSSAEYAEVQHAATVDTRLAFTVGAEQGALPDDVGLFGVSVSRLLPVGELRAAAWYAPGSEVEVADVAGNVVRASSSSFYALGLNYCFGGSNDAWVMGCGGLELGVSDLTRSEQIDGVQQPDEGELSAGLRPTAGALFAYRGRWLQPELLLSAAVNTLGSAPGTDWLALRVAGGVAVTF